MYIKQNKPIKGQAFGFTRATLRVCSDDRFNPFYHLFLMYEHYTLSISTRVDGTVLNGLTSFVGHYYFYWPNTEGSRTSTFANAAVYFRVPDVIFGSTPSSLCTALRTAGIHPWRQTEDRRLQSYCSILQLLKPFGNW